jgi:gamma-glutamyltranspeptidase / glutathione hydrolase
LKAIVVAAQAAAAEVGATVLEGGGNAIDAAVTTALAQGVLDPLNCGIGGFGSCVFLPAATRRPCSISFHGRAGALVTPEMWADAVVKEYDGGYRLRDFMNNVGYRSITTPGVVAGLAALLAEHGTRKWEECVTPAMNMASQGYGITPRALVLFAATPADNLPHPGARATASPAARRIFTADGHYPRKAGDLFVQRDYGCTLGRLGTLGPQEFYRGWVGQRIAADLGTNGGFVTAADLENYSVRRPNPLAGGYRGYTVLSDAPPSSGVTLLEMLHIAEHFDLPDKAPGSAEVFDLLARTMRFAYRDRARFLADPEYSEVDTEALLSKDYARAAADVIRSGEKVVVPRWRPDEHGTTHLCVVDRAGNIVSLTHSLGEASGVVTEGLGFQYNNAMNCFNPLPGHPNSIASGKARATGFAPTIILKDGQPAIVIGASGGTRIPTSIFQVVVNLIDFGMSPTEAVSEPRIDCQGETVEVEGRISDRVCEELGHRGHDVIKSHAVWWDWPLVHLAMRDAATGTYKGAADPRSEGTVMVVS